MCVSPRYCYYLSVAAMLVANRFRARKTLQHQHAGLRNNKVQDRLHEGSIRGTIDSVWVVNAYRGTPVWSATSRREW